MAELVDAPASGAGDRKVVEVRVLFRAPFPFQTLRTSCTARAVSFGFSFRIRIGLDGT